MYVKPVNLSTGFLFPLSSDSYSFKALSLILVDRFFNNLSFSTVCYNDFPGGMITHFDQIDSCGDCIITDAAS